MGGMKSLVLRGAFLAGAFSASTPALAQCRLCDQPTTARTDTADNDGLTVHVETSLNFDRLVLASAGQGTAIVRPDGSSSTEGSVVAISARAMVGTVSVHGTPGRIVRVELPGRIDLYSTGGGRIAVDEMVTDLQGIPKLDAAGNLDFHFGGRATVTGDADGSYRGEMPITVEYQ